MRTTGIDPSQRPAKHLLVNCLLRYGRIGIFDSLVDGLDHERNHQRRHRFKNAHIAHDMHVGIVDADDRGIGETTQPVHHETERMVHGQNVQHRYADTVRNHLRLDIFRDIAVRQHNTLTQAGCSGCKNDHGRVIRSRQRILSAGRTLFNETGKCPHAVICRCFSVDKPDSPYLRAGFENLGDPGCQILP